MTDDPLDDPLDDDRFDWLLQELNITTERAKERGLTPEEYLVGLRAYVSTFQENYVGVIEEDLERPIEGE